MLGATRFTREPGGIGIKDKVGRSSRRKYDVTQKNVLRRVTRETWKINQAAFRYRGEKRGGKMKRETKKGLL